LNVRSRGNFIQAAQVYDLTGRKFTPSLTHTEDGILFDITELPQGLFFVELRLANGKIGVCRFLKQ
jgi:hypothetical protein